MISLAEDDVGGALGAHDGDLGGRPGEDEVGAQVPRAHGDVAAAVGLAQDHRDLGHGGLAVGVEELGAVADDAGVLLVDARAGSRAGPRR